MPQSLEINEKSLIRDPVTIQSQVIIVLRVMGSSLDITKIDLYIFTATASSIGYEVACISTCTYDFRD